MTSPRLEELFRNRRTERQARADYFKRRAQEHIDLAEFYIRCMRRVIEELPAGGQGAAQRGDRPIRDGCESDTESLRPSPCFQVIDGGRE